MPLKWMRGLLTLVCISIMTACRSARPEEVPGEYQAIADWGTSSLILRADYTMEQEIKGGSFGTIKISGSWDFGSGSSVNIRPCLNISRTSTMSRADGCGYPAEVFLGGGVDLWIDSDNGFTYQKIKKK